MTSKNSSEHRESTREEYPEDPPIPDEKTAYPREGEENYHKQMIEWLNQNVNYTGNEVVQKLIRNKMSETHQESQGCADKFYEWVRSAPDDTQERQREIQTVKAQWATIRASLEMLEEKLWEAAEEEDIPSFKRILDETSQRDRALVGEIRENAGFTNLSEEQRPAAGEQLNTVIQATEFAARMNNIAENFNTPEYVPNPDMRNALQHQAQEFNRELARVVADEERLSERKANGSAHPWKASDPMDLLYVRRAADALNYITRPKDPEFWKMVDSYDHATGEVETNHVIQDKIHSALDAVNEVQNEGWGEREAAQSALNALAHVYDINIKSDLIDEDIGSYQTHVKEMESGSQEFARALRDGTGFIESPEYESPQFPQWANRPGSYVAEVSDKLRELNLNDEIETDHFKAVSFMIQEYAQANHKIIAGNFQEGDDDLNQILAHEVDTLRGIRIMMRPK